MLTPDWSQFGSKYELERKIGNGFKVKAGWTETKTDTVLCVESRSTLDVQMYTVYVWNQTGVREELAKLLGLPVYTEE